MCGASATTLLLSKNCIKSKMSRAKKKKGSHIWVAVLRCQCFLLVNIHSVFHYSLQWKSEDSHIVPSSSVIMSLMLISISKEMSLLRKFPHSTFCVIKAIFGAVEAAPPHGNKWRRGKHTIRVMGCQESNSIQLFRLLYLGSMLQHADVTKQLRRPMGCGVCYCARVCCLQPPTREQRRLI